MEPVADEEEAIDQDIGVDLTWIHSDMARQIGDLSLQLTTQKAANNTLLLERHAWRKEKLEMQKAIDAMASQLVEEVKDDADEEGDGDRPGDDRQAP